MEEEEANMEGGNMMHEEEDPYESFGISTSQQQLLDTVPFVGDTLTSPCNCNNLNHDAEIIPPVSSTSPVILLSAPDTQQHVDNQDVFHTLPEDPPLPSSIVDVSQCEFNQAVIDVDDVSQMFIHFPGFQKDSELGFVENSRFLEQDRLSEFPEIHPDEFSILDRAISDVDKAPTKKLKLGFDPLNVEQDSDELRNFDNEISCFREENLKFGFDSLEKNVETQQAVQNDAEDVNMVDVEGNKSSQEEEIMEISRMRKGPVLDLMPDSIHSSFEKPTANERGSGEDKEKETVTVFDVLKFLAETAVKEDDGLTLLETIKRAGVIFPRPSWWPDDMKSELFNLR